MTDSLFKTPVSDQHLAIDELMEESRADGDYYLYFTVASVIATLGLLNDNPIVVIGGMLIAPALFPILSLGMGVVTSSKGTLLRAFHNLGKSIVLCVVVAFVLSFILHESKITETMLLASSPDLSSILVALFSGVVASFAWVKRHQSAMLPGVAVAVSLVPPLANIGVGISLLSRQVFAGSLLMFLLNLIGIFFGSLLIFALFGFSNQQRWQNRRLQEEISNNK
jgi:uncharacterized hydrophobic protein (TIGR00271 family)